MRVSASLWSAGEGRIETAVQALRGEVDAFHLDVMDGRFVELKLFGIETVSAASRHARPGQVEVHLMVVDPDAWIEPCVAAGAGLVAVHPETCADPARTLAQIRSLGARAGLVVSLDSGLPALAPLLGAVDQLIVMGTPLGVKGRSLSPEALERTRQLRRDFGADGIETNFDGGIREEALPAIAAAGADGVVAGSLVFGREDWVEGIEIVRAVNAGSLA